MPMQTQIIDLLIGSSSKAISTIDRIHYHISDITKIWNYIWLEHPESDTPQKIGVCRYFAASTRYSLVKGERIVRFGLTARLRTCVNE